MNKYIQLPFPQFELTFPRLTYLTAISLHGHANVTENGEPGPSKKFRFQWVGTPGGQSRNVFSLK